MKTISAYIAEDGSLHRDRKHAAVADLVAIGFDPDAAAKIVDRHDEVLVTLRQISGEKFISHHYETVAAEDAGAMAA